LLISPQSKLTNVTDSLKNLIRFAPIVNVDTVVIKLNLFIL